MNYTKQDFVDKSEEDINGNYEYYYQYTLYYFVVGESQYVFRSYKDTDEEVSFLRKEVNGEYESLSKYEINSDELKEMIEILKEKENKITVNL